MTEKNDVWTVTVELSVFAGNMDKQNVMDNTEAILADITAGTDFVSFNVTGAKRND